MKITAALLLAVSLAGFANGQFVPQSLPRAPAGKPGTVDGLVINSVTSDPLRKAVVILQGVAPVESPPGTNIQAMTDAAGRFHFDKVDPGAYVINANRDGFMNVREHQAKMVKVGEEENVKDVTVALLPLARVSGHVFDEDGDPIMLASVQALRYGFNQGRKQLMPRGFATTNDLGEFQFLGLEPGPYFFIANARPPVQNLPPRTRFIGQLRAYAPTFYPSAADATQATATELAPGATWSNIDFRLRKVPAFRVRGKLVDAAGQPVHDAFVNLLDDAGAVPNTRAGSRPADDGTFTFPPVVPGRYSLSAMRGPQSESATERITVTDQDLDGLTLVLSKGIAISGRFSVEGPPPAQMNGQVNLQPADAFGQGFAGAVQQDGTFTIENVRPGPYLLHIFTGAPSPYVKSIRFGDADVSTGSLAITQGSTAALNIALGTDGGQVQGTIQTSSGTLAATGMISLFPTGDLSRRSDLFKQTRTDGAGNFKFQDVAPGEYKVYAWEEMVPDVIDVLEFRKALESKAVSVTVQPGGHESVQVPVIPAEDVEATKNKLQ
jgi:protocatechuate 3,4-dioxygenase beta subunit